MLVVVVGTPSPIALWTLHVVRVGMQVLFGDHRLLTSQSLEAFRRDRQGSSTDCTVLYTTSPTLGLARLLARAKAPIIAAVDDPRDVVSFRVSAEGLPIQQALRDYTRSVAILDFFSSVPTSTRVESSAYSKPFRTFLIELVNSCRLDIGMELREAVVAAVTGTPSGGDDISVGDLVVRDVPGADRPGECSALDARSKSLVEDIGRQYEAMPHGGDRATVACPLMLYIADKQICYEPEHPWLSMVGPARCILWGPYIHLPRGKWSAQVTFAVRGNISGNVLRIQVLRELSECATAVAKLADFGVFACELGFEIDDPLDRIEVTFALQEGAIEGEFRLVSLTFSRGSTGRQNIAPRSTAV